MMHEASSNIEEVPFCFSRPSIKFQGHMGQKKTILVQIERFQTTTEVLIHRWLRNEAQRLK